jgi:hypothetical protein
MNITDETNLFASDGGEDSDYMYCTYRLDPDKAYLVCFVQVYTQ